MPSAFFFCGAVLMSLRQCTSLRRIAGNTGVRRWTSSRGVISGLPASFSSRVLGARRINFITAKAAKAEGDALLNSFGAPLPPVEMAIDAERVQVAADAGEGDREATAMAISVVQQLRGSAPYVDLHRDSSMVVHLCLYCSVHLRELAQYLCLPLSMSVLSFR